MHMKIASKDRIGLEIMLPRQQDKCREHHVQAAINAPHVIHQSKPAFNLTCLLPLCLLFSICIPDLSFYSSQIHNDLVLAMDRGA